MMRPTTYLLLLLSLLATRVLAQPKVYCPADAVANRFCVWGATDQTGKWALFTIQSALQGWASLGVGTTMTNSDMVIGWRTSSGAPVLSDRFSTDRILPMFDSTQDVFESPQLEVTQSWARLSISFRRPIDAVNSSEDLPISRSGPTSFVWASQLIIPTSASPSATVASHASSNKGAFSFDFRGHVVNIGNVPEPGVYPSPLPSPSPDPSASTASTGLYGPDGLPLSGGSTESPVSSPEPAPIDNSMLPILSNLPYNVVALIHGYTMVAAWSTFAPLGILLARYGKIRFPKLWYPAHLVLAIPLTAGLALASSILMFLYSSPPHFLQSPHHALGYIMAFLLILQLVSGTISTCLFKTDRTAIPWYDKVHWWIGRIVFTLAIPQTFLGIKKYSVNDMWMYIYAGYLGLLIVVAVILEIKIGQTHHSNDENTQTFSIPSSPMFDDDMVQRSMSPAVPPREMDELVKRSHSFASSIKKYRTKDSSDYPSSDPESQWSDGQNPPLYRTYSRRHGDRARIAGGSTSLGRNGSVRTLPAYTLTRPDAAARRDMADD